MKERNFGEPQAYRWLRRKAMNEEQAHRGDRRGTARLCTAGRTTGMTPQSIFGSAYCALLMRRR